MADAPRADPFRRMGGQGMSRTLQIAIDPVETPYNSFVGRFANAVRATGASVVPYQSNLRALLRTDVAIIHWPTLFMGAHSRRKAWVQLARFAIARRRGMRLIWVAHNLAAHDESARRGITDRFIANLDGIIYLSQRSREMVRDTYRIAPHTRELTTVHPRYDSKRPLVAFSPPGAGEPVRLVTIGLVRRYKNHDELVAAARDLDPAAVRIAIVGKRYDPVFAAELAAAVTPGGAVGLEITDDLPSEDEMEATLDGAHGVVLPYRNILNSGSAIHALSRGRPVLVPALGSMPDLRAQVGERWVRLYDGALTPAVLAGFAAHVRGLEPGAMPDLSALSWERASDDLATLLQR